MKSVFRPALLLFFVSTFALAFAAEPEVAGTTVRVENLGKEENSEHIQPDVLVKPRPTPAQQLRSDLDAAQERLNADLAASQITLSKASGPDDRMLANRALQARKMAFEIEVFSFQLDYARAIEASEKISELEATLQLAQDRLERMTVDTPMAEVE